MYSPMHLCLSSERGCVTQNQLGGMTNSNTPPPPPHSSSMQTTQKNTEMPQSTSPPQAFVSASLLMKSQSQNQNRFKLSSVNNQQESKGISMPPDQTRSEELKRPRKRKLSQISSEHTSTNSTPTKTIALSQTFASVLETPSPAPANNENQTLVFDKQPLSPVPEEPSVNTVQNTPPSADTLQHSQNTTAKYRESFRFEGTTPNVAWKAYTEEEICSKDAIIPIEDHFPIEVPLFKRNQVCHLIPQGTDEWLDLRRGMLTSSNFRALLGMGLASTLDLCQNTIPLSYQELLEAVETSRKRLFPSSDDEDLSDDSSQFSPMARIHMAWGNHHENNAKASYVRYFPERSIQQTGLWTIERETIEELSKQFEDILPVKLDFNKMPRLGASPDGILLLENGEKQVLEVKCPSAFREQGGWDEAGNPIYAYRKARVHNRVKAMYVPQVMGQMLATGLKTAHYASWTNACMKVFELKYDAKYCATMLMFLQITYQKYIRGEGGEKPASDLYLSDPLLKETYISFLEETMAKEGTLLQTIEKRDLDFSCDPARRNIFLDE